MGRKLSDILKDRKFFTAEDEKWIHEESMKECEQILKNRNESLEDKENIEVNKKPDDTLNE